MIEIAFGTEKTKTIGGDNIAYDLRLLIGLPVDTRPKGSDYHLFGCIPSRKLCARHRLYGPIMHVSLIAFWSGNLQPASVFQDLHGHAEHTLRRHAGIVVGRCPHITDRDIDNTPILRLRKGRKEGEKKHEC